MKNKQKVMPAERSDHLRLAFWKRKISRDFFASIVHTVGKMIYLNFIHHRFVCTLFQTFQALHQRLFLQQQIKELQIIRFPAILNSRHKTLIRSKSIPPAND
jgi:hypothetical protein